MSRSPHRWAAAEFVGGESDNRTDPLDAQADEARYHAGKKVEVVQTNVRHKRMTGRCRTSRDEERPAEWGCIIMLQLSVKPAVDPSTRPPFIISHLGHMVKPRRREALPNPPARVKDPDASFVKIAFITAVGVGMGFTRWAGLGCSKYWWRCFVLSQLPMAANETANAVENAALRVRGTVSWPVNHLFNRGGFQFQNPTLEEGGPHPTFERWDNFEMVR
ncbi:hypothetical protein N657DRAFT_421863 [Parathielavia appendiculata]|uniref:Uncharacterized protein n=1 Tax=Parathielavia appendiculata TaxID=2587402 RepID=A0AAN6Z3B3_9PEZI|nr:hypothetical protein N657DRAFT_421863 [Parathielavia appendiculata]